VLRESKTVVILQPSYLPWLGYFAQLYECDVFVVYDDVQYDKHSWRNRNRIKTARGIIWLTIPVLTHGKNRPSNREIEIDNRLPWAKKHFETIRQSYARAPYFRDYFGLFQELYARQWTRLLDVNLAFFQALAEAVGIRRPILMASGLGVPGESTERLVRICQSLGATRFYEGASGRDYIDASLFDRAGVQLDYQDYVHPRYPQLHGSFTPYLSIVDLLFNCGPASLEVLLRPTVVQAA
jgi:hypothetical protein